MINKKIEEIKEFICEDFITYPSLEDGVFYPQLKFRKSFESEEEEVEFDKKIINIFENKGYWVVPDECGWHSKWYDYIIFPNVQGAYNPRFENIIKEDWSVEEMLDLLITLLKK